MKIITLPLNHVHIATLLSQCGKNKLYNLGSSLHAATFKISHLFSYENITILHNSLISMYSKCGKLLESQRVFNQIVRKDTISWNSVISSCFINNDPCSGFDFFKRMRDLGSVYDHATLTTVLSICSKPDMMHCFSILTGFVQVVQVGNALISAYFKHDSPNCAQALFDEMQDRNVITWTAIVSGMAQTKLFDKSLIIFKEMREFEAPNCLTYLSALFACSGLRAIKEGQQIHALVAKYGLDLDFIVKSALMDLYSKCGMINDASSIYGSCKTQDDVSLTVMLVGYAQNGLEEKALQFFHEIMHRGMDVDASMVSAVLGAFGIYAPLSLGKQIHSLTIKKCLDRNIFVSNGLINMYSKCGEVKDSIVVFDCMTKRNVVSWNSMIAAFARHGHGFEALELYKHMKLESIEPNDVTYVSLLHACSHVGEIEKGMEFLNEMSFIHGFEPRVEHYSCVVDLLGRGGFLKEAKELIEGLNLKKKALLWQALLGGCGIHGDYDMGKYTAAQLVNDDPNCTAAYVVLANVCSYEGKWEDRANFSKKMKELGVKKEAGLSWIEVEKRVHSFVVEDKSHPCTEVIYEALGELRDLIRKEEMLHDFDIFY